MKIVRGGLLCVAGWVTAKRKWLGETIDHGAKNGKMGAKRWQNTESLAKSLISFIGARMTGQNPPLVIEGHDWLNYRNPSWHGSRLRLATGCGYPGACHAVVPATLQAGGTGAQVGLEVRCEVRCEVRGEVRGGVRGEVRGEVIGEVRCELL
jgi:hypothetical protein